jgi:hypothetical protein
MVKFRLESLKTVNSQFLYIQRYINMFKYVGQWAHSDPVLPRPHLSREFLQYRF